MGGHKWFAAFCERMAASAEKGYMKDVRREMAGGASGIVLVHNHPSGVAEPSAPDIRLTERLKDLLAEIDVRVLDHMIVAGGEITSLAERGLL